MSERISSAAPINGRGEGNPPGSEHLPGDRVSPPGATWELLARGMEAGLLLLEADGSISYATSRARAILGIGNAEPPGKLSRLAEGNEVARELAGWIPMEGEVPSGPRRYFLQLGSEGESFLSITLSPIRTDGNPCRWAVLLEDVSGVIRKGQEAAVWARNLVHDLKSPLSSVTGAIDLIFSGRLGPVDQKLLKFLNILKKGADRMVEMLDGAGEQRPPGTPDLEVVKEVSFPLVESHGPHGPENPGCG